MAQIQISRGGFDGTCTTSSSLSANYMTKEVCREIIEMTEGRSLTTLITSSITDGRQVPSMKPKIKIVDETKSIGANAYRFRKMGRIQMASEIIAQVGTTASDGSFALQMNDDYLYEGNVVTFYAPYFQARAMSNPTGVPGNFVVQFQSQDGSLFDWNTHVAPQAGTKTCFGGYTSYEERSLRGYSRSHYPDEYIQHMNIQRKTVAFSGDALTTVLKYVPNGKKGDAYWDYVATSQARAQFNLEDDFQKMYGRSNMIDANGNLRPAPFQKSRSTGEDIMTGMGLDQQIEGENDSFASGSDGRATINDHMDMMTTLSKRSNKIMGGHWYVTCGTDGYIDAQQELRDFWRNSLGGQSNANASDVEIEVGHNFNTFNFAGQKITFILDPQKDDDKKFPARTTDGRLASSRTYHYFDASVIDAGGMSNIEILKKNANGVDRSFVSITLNGITGSGATPVDEVDALRMAMLKQEMIVCYSTQSSGRILPF